MQTQQRGTRTSTGGNTGPDTPEGSIQPHPTRGHLLHRTGTKGKLRHGRNVARPSLTPPAVRMEPPSSPPAAPTASSPAPFPTSPPPLPPPAGAQPQTRTHSSRHGHALRPHACAGPCTRGSKRLHAGEAGLAEGRAVPGEELCCRGPAHALRYTWLQSFSKVSLFCSSCLMSWKNCLTSTSIS